MFFTIIIFILILSLLVFVHEMGHFVSARIFGVKAEEFGFGFPPRLIGVYKNQNNRWKIAWGTKKPHDPKDTVYSLNAIPLGGFVKIKGENGPTSGGNTEEDRDSFTSKPIWQRAIILSAGVFMNVVLTVVLVSIGFMTGLPQVINGQIDDRAKISNRNIQITQVLPDTPANGAGVKMGDIIYKINNQEFTNIKTLQDFVSANTGKDLNYEIKRGESTINLIIKPEILDGVSRGGIGVSIAETGIVSYPWYRAIWEGLTTTLFMLGAITLAFGDLIKNLILGHGVGGEITGPVGIANLTGDMARLGFVYLLQFTAMLSANLAVINFLPFPALDGGRVLFLLAEKLKGGPLKRNLEASLHYAGFILLIILVIFVTIKDIAKI